MKKAIIALMCIGMAVSAFAQSSVNNVDQKHYNKIYFSYSPQSLDLVKLVSVGNVNTFGINYLHGVAVADVPLYVEFGASLQYANYRIGGLNLDGNMLPEEGAKTSAVRALNDPIKCNAFALEIPVNFGYRLSLANGKCHLTPYAGLFVKANLSMKAKGHYTGTTDDSSYDFEYNMLAGGTNYDEVNIPGYAKRFQLGWQAGVTFDAGNFYLLAGYRADASSLLKCGLSAKAGGVNLGIGVIF